MPLMPGYSHYFLARHLAQEHRRAQETQDQAAEPKLTAQAEEKDFRSGLALVLILVCVPLIAVAMLSLLGM